jgi:hypothetical protein
MTPGPAEEFILSTLRSEISPHTPARAEWNSIYESAQAHGLAALLYERLKSSAPDEFLAPFRTAYFLSLTRNQFLFDEFVDLARLFEIQRLPIVALKGLAVGPSLYDSLALRPLHDLDLLIRPEHIPVAQEILRARDFSTEAELAPGYRARYQIDLSFTRLTPFPHNVELHWRLFRSRYAELKTQMEWFWAHTEETEISRQSARVFQPTAQFLHLAGHAALGHRGERWLWLYDIARLVEKRGAALDWDELVRKGNEFGLMRALQTTCAALRELFGTPIPPEIAQRISGARVSTLERINFAFANAPDDQARVIGDGLMELVMEHHTGIWRAHLFPGRAFLGERYGAGNPFARARFVLQRSSYLLTRAPRFLWRLLRGTKK